jgi:hypothetical protein
MRSFYPFLGTLKVICTIFFAPLLLMAWTRHNSPYPPFPYSFGKENDEHACTYKCHITTLSMHALRP